MTSGYSVMGVTQWNTVSPTAASMNMLFELNANDYLMAVAPAANPFYNHFYIERLPSGNIVVNDVTTNYTNPPLTQVSRFYMNKPANNTNATVNLFFNSTSPVYYLRVTSGVMNYINDPASKMSFVEAPVSPATAYSYWQFNSAIKYRVRLSMTAAGTTNTAASH